MVNVDKAVIARYKSQGVNFEVLVDCDKAMDFRAGKSVSMKDMLADEKIFADSKKGMESSPTDVKKVFNTDDIIEAAKQIIKKGDIQLTAEYKNRLKEVKMRKLISIIHRNGVEPTTNAPHPLTRIEAAINEANIKIDERRPVEEQVHDVLNKLRPIIPIKFVIKEMEIIVPGKYTGKTYPLFKSYGKITREEWRNDGSHLAILEIPGGLEEEFLNQLNSVTHGDIEFRVVRTK